MLRDLVFSVVDALKGMLPQVQNVSSSLLFLLLTLDLILFGIFVALGQKANLADLVMQVLKIGFFIYLLNNFVGLSRSFMQLIIHAASFVGGNLTETFLSDPSAIVTFAWNDVLEPLSKLIDATTGWMTKLNLQIMYGISWVIITACFIIISLQLAIAFIEYHIMVYMGLVLFPFTCLEITSFIGSKVFSSVSGQAIKLGIIALVTGLAVNIYKTLLAFPNAEQFNVLYLIKLSATTLCLLLITLQVPALISSFLGGIPNFSITGFAQNIATLVQAGKAAGQAFKGGGDGSGSGQAMASLNTPAAGTTPTESRSASANFRPSPGSQNVPALIGATQQQTNALVPVNPSTAMAPINRTNSVNTTPNSNGSNGAASTKLLTYFKSKY